MPVNKNASKSNQHPLLFWFIMIQVLLFSVFFIFNLLADGTLVNTLVLNTTNQFTDHFMHIGFASAPWGTNIYEFSPQACFPPFAYLLYGILARIVGYQAADPANILSHHGTGNNNMLMFIICCAICIVLFTYAISLHIKQKGFLYQTVYPCLLILSYPFAFSSIERGNSVLLVAILSAIAIAWKDDSSKAKQELALILIAICAGLKIYPAIFGLLYLKEKRFHEALRLLLYGSLVFFLPFVFFGGIDGFLSFSKSILALNGEIHRFSISGFFETITEKIFGATYPFATVIVQQGFFLLSIAAFFLCREKWEAILLLCCVMTVYISSGWMYTCVYILPAMLYFFGQKCEQPVQIRPGRWGEGLAVLMFIATFTLPIDTDKTRIYDCIIVFDSILIMKILIESIKNRAKMQPSPSAQEPQA